MQHQKSAARLVVALIATTTLGSAPLLVSAGTADAGDFRAVAVSRRVHGAAAAQSPTASFLGFAPGEERRYVLGPEEELLEGEYGYWSIRLQELLGDPADGIFALTHSWQAAATQEIVDFGAVTGMESSGELRVNAHGFPLEVRFETKRHLAGLGDEVYTVRYRFRDGAFRKHLAQDGREAEHPVMLRSNDNRDLSVPRGVWVFVPRGPDCSFSYPLSIGDVGVVRAPRQTAGTSPSPPVAEAPTVYADNRACAESLFFNPGLISLMLPALWEAGSGEHEYVLLTPAGSFGTLGPLVQGRAGGLAVSTGDDLDTRAAMSPRVNSWVETLRYVDRTPVQVGRRMLDAWVFTGMAALDNIYVDDDGVVLRVDLARHFWEQLGVAGLDLGVDPEQADFRRLHVRLLFPSEY